MSWGVSAIGKVPAVRKVVAEQFTRNQCAEPEETVRQAAGVLIDAALAAQKETGVVKVSASGSQSCDNWETKTGLTNQLSISIDPQNSFLE